MMSTNSPDEPEIRAIDRFLALASITLIVAAVLCFLAVIIATAVGVGDFNSVVWQIIFGVMYFGLPLGVVLFFALLILSTVRRARATKHAKEG